jgi:hypothetical protein
LVPQLFASCSERVYAWHFPSVKPILAIVLTELIALERKGLDGFFRYTIVVGLRRIKQLVFQTINLL